MRKLAIFLAAALALPSCIYPFTADLTASAEQTLVIEGDIRIGDITVVSLGYMLPLTASADKQEYPPMNARIESGSGAVFSPYESTTNKYYFDLQKASPDDTYRLVIEAKDGSGNVFSTPFMDVQKAPAIRESSYVVDGDYVDLTLSLDGNGEDRYFCWSYEETWEFHVEFIPLLMYDPLGPASEPYRERLPEEDYYYCWRHSSSKENVLVSSEGLKENRISQYAYLHIPRKDKRVSVLYSIELDVRALSKDGYSYVRNMNLNSDNTGSLFAPVPSYMPGNIVNEAHPEQQVIGYVDAYVPVKCRMFVKEPSAYTGGYLREEDVFFVPEPDEDGVIDYDMLYAMGDAPYGPYTMGGSSSIYWAPKRCLDCREAGGSKTKPSYWPNDHK